MADITLLPRGDPQMMRQRRGAIVNIGSVATRGIYRVPYSAAKGGVHALTVSLAMELAEYNIRVNCVAPGAIRANRIIPRRPFPPTETEKGWHAEVITQTLRDSFQARLGEASEVASAVAVSRKRRIFVRDGRSDVRRRRRNRLTDRSA